MSAWNVQSAVAGTGTVKVPAVAMSTPSRVPEDQSRNLHESPFDTGMVKVACVFVITGRGVEAWAGRANAIPTVTLKVSTTTMWLANRFGRRFWTNAPARPVTPMVPLLHPPNRVVDGAASRSLQSPYAARYG